MSNPAFPDDGDYSVTDAAHHIDADGQDWLTLRINGRTVARRLTRDAAKRLCQTVVANHASAPASNVVKLADRQPRASRPEGGHAA